MNVIEMKCLRPMVEVPIWDSIRNEQIRRRAGTGKLSQRMWIEECYDGLETWKGWMSGAGQERSEQLKWKINRGEEFLG